MRDGNEVRGEGQHATKVHAGLELGMLNLPSLATRTPHDVLTNCDTNNIPLGDF